MRILVTGASGYVGSELAPRLTADGHAVRALVRSPERLAAAGVTVDEVVTGDVVTGAGLGQALDGIDVAYYLIHSMEGTATNGAFVDDELRGARAFGHAAKLAGVRRIVYLGGLVPHGARVSRHLSSRLAVEDALMEAAPEPIAFRASIVVGARSRSFRFLVRLVERLPVMALPAWRDHRTQPIDGRDMLEFLRRAATAPARTATGSHDIAGPEVVTYAQMIDRIREHLMVPRPTLRLGFNLTPVASAVAAAVAGEDVGLIRPLMESLEYDLLPRDQSAAAAFGVRLHRLNAAVEHALREWERREELSAR